MKKMIAYIMALSSMSIDGAVHISGNLNNTPREEVVTLSATKMPKGYRNRVMVYSDPGKTKHYFFGDGDKRKPYALVGDFSWTGEKAGETAAYDFDDDGLHDIIFFNRNEESGRVLTYDRKTRRFQLLPVALEHSSAFNLSE